MGSTRIGTIVASTSHLTYLCRVYGDQEVRNPPAPLDHGLGQFVYVETEDSQESGLVGIITDTVLFNPEYGNYGPRLSSHQDLEVFAPDSLAERGVLVVIRVLGLMKEGIPDQQIPIVSSPVGALVSIMEEDTVINFHESPTGKFRMEYFPRMIQYADPVINSLMVRTLERIAPAFPAQAGIIGLLRRNLAWQTQIVPLE